VGFFLSYVWSQVMLFSPFDIAEWELGFECGRIALDIAALKPHVPEFMRISVLDVTQEEPSDFENQTAHEKQINPEN
jgi:hypothetical protein